VRKPFVLAILAILLAGLILFARSDTTVSIADTNTSNNEVASSTGNSSASATITITMYAVGDEQASEVITIV
jgi:hypothetical protein